MKILYIIVSYLYSLLLPSKKIVYFCSFFGQFSDNPKYIYKKLVELYPDINIAWCINKANSGKFPNGVKKVVFQSFFHYYYIYNASVVVDNNMGLRQYLGTDGLIHKMLFGRLSCKSEKQLNISTWHGTPYKCIGMDSIDFPKNYRFYHNADYVVAGCNLTYEKFKKAFGGELPIAKYGTPRNDIFFERIDVVQIKEKLKLPVDKKLMLFAPTFRKEMSQNGACQLDAIQPRKLLNELNSKYEEEWVIVCRFHSHVLSEIDLTGLYNDSILNGNIGDDMQEYLLCADALITDFSSSFFDYALTKKPCFLFAPDMEHYASSERGVYITKDELPYTIAYTSEDLLNNIMGHNGEIYAQKINSFLKKIGDFEDGKASSRAVKDIAYFYFSKQKRQVYE